MASINGVLSQPSHSNFVGASPQLSAKRKRAESSEPLEQTNGTADSKPATPSQAISRDSQQQVIDFIDVLKSHDVSPSILNRQLPGRESSTEPHPKRKKAESDTDASTIISNGASGIYSSLEDVMSDVRVACSAVLAELHLPNGAARTQFTPVPPPISELASKVKAFNIAAEHILQGEKAHRNRRSSARPEKSKESEADAAKSLTNGTVLENAVTQLTAGQGDNKLVLTLYGNAPGAKQLFSSLQQPVKAADGKTDVVQPLREAGLPNGINTTQIVPLQSSGLVDEKKRVPTMGELFTNSTSSLPFQPPKPSQYASTRSSTVGWYQPSGLDSLRSRGNQSYFGQSITSGQWLDYTGASTSVDAKRKQRERALSLGGGKVPSSSADSAEQASSKLDALFRSAYSSFAPVKDDSAAIIPEGMLDRIWWQRVGEKSFERLVGNATKIEAAITPVSKCTTEPILAAQDNDAPEIEELQTAVEDWDEQAMDPSLEETQVIPKSIEDKNVEEILQEISELLETLNSYQRIRNISLNPLPRSGGTGSATDPAKPNEAEIATYNTLKSQLTLMVSMLPPYAVAKLNSDQLAELNISTKMQVLTDNYKGVMEEDEAAARAKVAEMRAATSSRPSPSTSIHRSTSSLYGNQYSSSGRPAISSGQQYYPQTQTPARAPSTTLQRPPSTVPAPYPGGRPPSGTSYRQQTSYSTPTYAHQLPRSSQSQYGPPSSQQYFQTPTPPSYGQTPSQSYGSVSQTNPSARYQAPNQVSYLQNRTQSSQSSVDYRYSNGTNSARQTSPQKPQSYSPQLQAQSRPFGTPTPSLSQDHRYFQPSVANGTSTLSPQQQVSQQQPAGSAHLGATGYHTVMTAEQQSTMMERQRAQLAQQQGTQHHARNAAQAGVMGVPSGSKVNGGSAVTAGL